MKKCSDCQKKKPDVKDRIDKGLRVGKICQECFIRLIRESRQKSW